MSQPQSPGSSTAGVIHDIGYRHYTGERRGPGAIAGSLLRQGALSAFGFGRSAKAKVLPFVLLGFALVPALVQIGIMTVVGRMAPGQNPFAGPPDYAGYQQTVSMVVALFVAAQSPVLFTRDLRSGMISLYLARPLGPAAFALVRWGSLVLANLVFLLVPQLLLLVGALSAGQSFADQLPEWPVAVAGSVLLAVLLATVGAVISSMTTRRGLAVGATIMVLLIGTTMIVVLQEVARTEGQDRLGVWLSLLSPMILVDSVQHGLAGVASGFETPAPSRAVAVLLLLTSLGLCALGLLGLGRRYRTKGSR